MNPSPEIGTKYFAPNHDERHPRSLNNIEPGTILEVSEILRGRLIELKIIGTGHVVRFRPETLARLRQETRTERPMNGLRAHQLDELFRRALQGERGIIFDAMRPVENRAEFHRLVDTTYDTLLTGAAGATQLEELTALSRVPAQQIDQSRELAHGNIDALLERMHVEHRVNA